ncbi:GNAT family N-acetyltransferase [Nocardioides carbamazepini]|uniref:GNAT family N-acetyltransferase n=1 Tax=Nocardioides carbamazepini TaxID=2854259 RepID=UPI00214A7E7A|nr:GNAT family N-acetyltransferase [Nocardioides carbamazepini]MCR1781998.1 GNAT family N-acetyltransferase [Nocardioides carbamazepini]
MTTFTTQVEVGGAATARLGRLSGWIDERSAEFCTTADWLRAAARHLPGTPVVITVGPADAPAALAALSLGSRRGIRRIELLGGDLNDYGRLFHEDDVAAAALADALVRWLASHRSWSLDLDQLDPDDAAVRVLTERLPGCRVETGPPMPRIEGVGGTFRISRNRRRSVRRATGRLDADGRAWRTVVATDLDDVERWLPVLVEVRRRRDHAAGRRSHLDDPRMRSFHEAVLLDAAARGRLVVDVLVVDDDVAGYAVTMVDGETYRLFDGRVAEEWQRYQGGIVCDMLAVVRAAEAPGVTTFDWLRGRTEAKFGDHETRRVAVRAASGAVVVAVDAWADGLRRRARAAVPASLVRSLVAR